MGNPRESGDPHEVIACFEALPAVIWAFEGPEHRVVAANRAARASVGGRCGMLGRPVRHAIPGAAGQQLFEQLEQVHATGEPIIRWGRRRSADSDGDCGEAGESREPDGDFVLIPQFAEDGSVHGVLGHGLDPVHGRILAPEVILAAENATAGMFPTAVHPAERRLPVAPDVARTLQQVLLPAGLPVPPQVWMAAQHLVAGDESATGGDWFDAIPLGRGGSR